MEINTLSLTHIKIQIYFKHFVLFLQRTYKLGLPTLKEVNQIIHQTI